MSSGSLPDAQARRRQANLPLGGAATLPREGAQDVNYRGRPQLSVLGGFASPSIIFVRTQNRCGWALAIGEGLRALITRARAIGWGPAEGDESDEVRIIRRFVVSGPI